VYCDHCACTLNVVTCTAQGTMLVELVCPYVNIDAGNNAACMSGSEQIRDEGPYREVFPMHKDAMHNVVCLRKPG
jgi:hypothetical protein